MQFAATSARPWHTASALHSASHCTLSSAGGQRTTIVGSVHFTSALQAASQLACASASTAHCPPDTSRAKLAPAWTLAVMIASILLAATSQAPVLWALES